MLIGEVEAASGVPAKTIRFWEEKRLLPEPARTTAGYRRYGDAVVDRLAFIRSAQAARFSLAEIRQVLDIGDSGRAPCEHVRDLVANRLAGVEARIAELAATRDHLRGLARRADAQDPAECHGYCVILQPEGSSPARHGGAPVRVRDGARRPRGGRAALLNAVAPR